MPRWTCMAPSDWPMESYECATEALGTSCRVETAVVTWKHQRRRLGLYSKHPFLWESAVKMCGSPGRFSHPPCRYIHGMPGFLMFCVIAFATCISKFYSAKLHQVNFLSKFPRILKSSSLQASSISIVEPCRRPPFLQLSSPSSLDTRLSSRGNQWAYTV